MRCVSEAELRSGGRGIRCRMHVEMQIWLEDTSSFCLAVRFVRPLGMAECSSLLFP